MSLFLKTAEQVTRPDPYILMSEWAEQKFKLAEYSAEKGSYRISRTPFMREILEELSPQSQTQEIVLMKPTQLAGTTGSLILICFGIDTGMGDTLMMMPTESMAKRFSKKRLAKTIEIMPDLQEKIGPVKTRNSANTILDKVYAGGSITLSGSNSGASYRSDTYRVVIGDDLDGFDLDIGGEGDPSELLDARTGSINNSKVYKNSTPTLKETSLIYREFKSSSQGKFHVPCPECKEFQYLKWGGPDADMGIKFDRDDDGDIIDIWYECEHCHYKTSEHKKPWMIERGKYVHKYPNRKKRGFQYNALYTPLGWKNTWARLAEKFLVATKELKGGQPQKMITFTNTMMAEPWEGMGEQPPWGILAKRVEPYPEKTVPNGGLFLTCAIDTHDTRLDILVRAWGRDEESWLVYHTKLQGDPNSPEVWVAADMIINAGYEHEGGHMMHIVSVNIDSGGHRQQAVYNFCRIRAPRVAAIKGSGRETAVIMGMKPSTVDVTFAGQTIPGGCKLWTVGTYQAKTTIYSRVALAGSGAGVYHWPEGTTDEYFKELTAEKLKLKYVKGYPRYEWTLEPGRANHALDLEVYAYAAAIRAGMNRPGFWDSIEQDLHRKQVKTAEVKEKTGKGEGFLPKKKGWLT